MYLNKAKYYGKKRVIMINIKFSIIVGCVLLLMCCHSGCIDNEQDEPIVMTFGELIADYKSTYNWEAAYRIENFTSLTHGDTLILRDQIYNISYLADENITQIEFNSSIGLENFFPILGNITGSFSIGDTVEIRLHIIKVTFSRIENERSVTIERETYKEGYDTSTNTYIPVPAQYITLADNTP